MTHAHGPVVGGPGNWVVGRDRGNVGRSPVRSGGHLLAVLRQEVADRLLQEIVLSRPLLDGENLELLQEIRLKCGVVVGPPLFHACQYPIRLC